MQVERRRVNRKTAFIKSKALLTLSHSCCRGRLSSADGARRKFGWSRVFRSPFSVCASGIDLFHLLPLASDIVEQDLLAFAWSTCKYSSISCSLIYVSPSLSQGACRICSSLGLLFPLLKLLTHSE